MKVSVIGTGYVGLVSAVCLAEKGHTVVCVDIDEKKIEKIRQGTPPIFEAGLESLLRKNIQKNLQATTDLDSAVRETDITLIAVGTPFDGSEIDLRFVKEVSGQIGRTLRDKNGYHVVVVKSTVVPGTTDNVVTPILERTSNKRLGSDLGVGMNPEFLTEGQAVKDFMFPDRIVIGGSDDKTRDSLEELYAGFDGVPKVRTNNKTAEMIKYTSNAMLANAISFSNEIANLCSALGDIDAADVMKGIHLSSYLKPTASNGERVQAPLSSFYEAGCGFGGSCLPKDVNALIAHGERAGRPMRLLREVININQQQPLLLLRKLEKRFSSLRDVRVSVLGLAFKADTDDMRESPAIPVINGLIKSGAIVTAYDPVAIPEARKIFADRNVSFCQSLEDAVKEADAIIIVTRWDEFNQLPSVLKSLRKDPLVLDGRRMLDKTTIANYDGIGI